MIDEPIIPSEPTKEPFKPSSGAVLIEVGQAGAFHKTLQKLNRKAATFELPPIRIRKETQVVYERVIKPLGNNDKMESYLKPVGAGLECRNPVHLTRFEIEYPLIKLGDWQVVGKLELIGDQNLQFQVTSDSRDAEAIADFASRPICCQHCNTKRRRNDGYVLRDQSCDTYLQVGASCLQDFTGIDPAAALFLAKMWQVIREEEYELLEFLSSGKCNAVSTREFLADVCFLADTFGFVSSAKARDSMLSPTWQDAVGLHRNLDQDETLRGQYRACIDKNLEKADAIREWAAGLPATSSFNANLQLLLKEDSLALKPRHLAFASAGCAMFSKDTTEKRVVPVSQHVGLPGEKMTRRLSLRRAIPFVSVHGVSTLVLMADEQGNQFKWTTSACPREFIDCEEPLRFEATFKVKTHETYKGICQTAVTHLKVQETAEAAL